MSTGDKEVHEQRIKRLKISVLSLSNLLSYPQCFIWYQDPIPANRYIWHAFFVPDHFEGNIIICTSHLELRIASATFDPVPDGQPFPLMHPIAFYPGFRDRDGNEGLYVDFSYIGNCSAHGDALNREIKGTKPHWEKKSS